MPVNGVVVTPPMKPSSSFNYFSVTSRSFLEKERSKKEEALAVQTNWTAAQGENGNENEKEIEKRLITFFGNSPMNQTNKKNENNTDINLKTCDANHK